MSVPQKVDRGNGLSVLEFLIQNGSEPQEKDPFVKRDPFNMGAFQTDRMPTTITIPGPYADNLPVFPAIAIPIENKKTFECPTNILKGLESAIPEVTKVLIIGWQAKEAHFLEMLRSRRMDSLKHVMVVDHDRQSAVPILEHFLEAIGKKYQPSVKRSLAEGGFSNLISTNGAKAFLEA